MALFKLSVVYENTPTREIVEIEAKNPGHARKICEEIVERDRDRIEKLTSLNVYDSRVIRSCELCPYDLRTEILTMMDSLILKDDV